YVVVGDLERQKYGNRPYRRFLSFGSVAFQHGPTTIYRVSPAGAASQPKPVAVDGESAVGSTSGSK
ncbi:MAG: hypothetical protein ACYDAG_11485, partial [Chloroflexota bacterium]